MVDFMLGADLIITLCEILKTKGCLIGQTKYFRQVYRKVQCQIVHVHVPPKYIYNLHLGLVA